MKIISAPRINAFGKKGPEEMADKVLMKLGVDAEKIDIDNSDIDNSEKMIYLRAKEIFKDNEKVVFVGGDHSITYPIFKAFSEKNKNAFLIVFDAHADCMPPMKEPTHEEFLRAIIEGGFDASKIILVGARKFEDVEKKFLEDNGVKVFGDAHASVSSDEGRIKNPYSSFNKSQDEGNIKIIADYISERANGMDVYVSVDIDVLDPAFAPAVNYPEPNGLSSRELFYLLKRIFCIKSLKALDVVEVVPEKDEKYNYRTVNVAVKVVQEFLKNE